MKGGGVFITSSYPLFINNTVCNNKVNTHWSGGGIHAECDAIIYNTILWGNANNIGPYQVGGFNHPDFYYCNIQNGRSGIGNPEDNYQGKTIEIIDVDPDFVSSSYSAGLGYDGLAADWSYSEFSPNINAGIHDISELNLPATDIAGNPRINHGVVDIGAYESQAHPLEIIQQPVNFSKCAGDNVEFKLLVNGPARYQWYKNNQPIPGAVDSVLVINNIVPGDEANYHCIAENGYGPVSSNNVFLAVSLPPQILYESFDTKEWTGINEPLELRLIVQGTAPISYQWQKNDTDITGANSPDFTLIPQSYDEEGIYRCIVDNKCGFKVSVQTAVYITTQICMVTIDPNTGNNLVIWEKSSKALIEAYNIYRESKVAGIYDLMGTVADNDLSIYADTTADPTVRAYIYKITGVGSNFETDLDLSKPHKTIHLLVSTNPELQTTQLEWDRYYGFDYPTYFIYRSATKGNFEIVDEVSSSLSSWTDPNPLPETGYYRISVEKPEPCYPTISGKKADDTPWSHSYSNIEDNRLQAGESPPDTIMLTKSNIDENNNYGAMIGRFQTFDSDTLDSHTYTLVSGDVYQDNMSFTILGDMLLAAEIFDYEIKPDYTIRVRCKDEGNLIREEIFVIQVNDITDEVGIQGISSCQIKTYPNPFDESTTLMFNNPEGNTYTLYIMEISGKVCRIKHGITASKYVLEKRNLEKGIYFIELRGEKFFRGKIVVE